MLIISLAVLFSVLGFTTIIADCSMPHGSSLRIIPGVMSILVFITLWVTAKRNRFNSKNIVFAVLAFSIAFINLMAFTDWMLWVTGIKPDNISLSRIKFDTEIEDVDFAKLFIIGDEADDYYLLIVRDGELEEKYYVDLDRCIVSLIPNLRCSFRDDGSIRVDRSILSGRKFNFDLIVECGRIDTTITINITDMKETDSFKQQPILLNKKIILIK